MFICCDLLAAKGSGVQVQLVTRITPLLIIQTSFCASINMCCVVLQVEHATHRAETKLQKEGARAQLLAAEAKDAAESKGGAH